MKAHVFWGRDSVAPAFAAVTEGETAGQRQLRRRTGGFPSWSILFHQGVVYSAPAGPRAEAAIVLQGAAARPERSACAARPDLVPRDLPAERHIKTKASRAAMPADHS